MTIPTVTVPPGAGLITAMRPTDLGDLVVLTESGRAFIQSFRGFTEIEPAPDTGMIVFVERHA